MSKRTELVIAIYLACFLLVLNWIGLFNLIGQRLMQTYGQQSPPIPAKECQSTPPAHHVVDSYVQPALFTEPVKTTRLITSRSDDILISKAWQKFLENHMSFIVSCTSQYQPLRAGEKLVVFPVSGLPHVSIEAHIDFEKGEIWACINGGVLPDDWADLADGPDP